MATDLTALTATIKGLISWAAETGLDLGDPSYHGSHTALDKVTFGTGSNKSNQLFTDNRIIAGSATDSLDLAGTLTNWRGQTITFSKIHAILIHNRSDETWTVAGEGVAHTATAAVVNVTRPAANGLVLFAAASDALVLAAGDWMLLYSKAGITVTADTGDLLNLIETAAVEAAVTVVLIGEQA